VLAGLSRPIPLTTFEYHQGEGMMEDAFAYLDHLCSLAKVEANTTLREHSRLAIDERAQAEEFSALFQTRFENRDEFFRDEFVMETFMRKC
jgi:hypothetical protein